MNFGEYWKSEKEQIHERTSSVIPRRDPRKQTSFLRMQETVPIGGLAPFPTNILPAFTGGAFSIPTYITYKFKGIQAIPGETRARPGPIPKNLALIPR